MTVMGEHVIPICASTSATMLRRPRSAAGSLSPAFWTELQHCCWLVWHCLLLKDDALYQHANVKKTRRTTHPVGIAATRAAKKEAAMAILASILELISE